MESLHSSRDEKGPDVVIEYRIGDRVNAVMFVESEVGHDQGSAMEYFKRLSKRLRRG